MSFIFRRSRSIGPFRLFGRTPSADPTPIANQGATNLHRSFRLIAASTLLIVLTAGCTGADKTQSGVVTSTSVATTPTTVSSSTTATSPPTTVTAPAIKIGPPVSSGIEGIPIPANATRFDPFPGISTPGSFRLPKGISLAEAEAWVDEHLPPGRPWRKWAFCVKETTPNLHWIWHHPGTADILSVVVGFENSPNATPDERGRVFFNIGRDESGPCEL